jgi:hypothetical protein
METEAEQQLYCRPLFRSDYQLYFRGFQLTPLRNHTFSGGSQTPFFFQSTTFITLERTYPFMCEETYLPTILAAVQMRGPRGSVGGD